MKRLYIQLSAAAILGIGTFYSCSKSFLELTPKGQVQEEDYYSNPTEAFSGLVAAYAPLLTETGGSDNTYTDPLGPLNAASDDCFAGGGSSSDMSGWQAWNNYSLNAAQGPQGGFWSINFLGVNRTNTILSKLDNVPGLSDDLKNRYKAEAMFLRAHYYFDLVRLFRNVPLILKVLPLNEVYTTVQAKPEDVYAQIETDLKAAIGVLPQTVPAGENGRATKGAAIALLGKVYLYEKKWTDAVAQLSIVNGPTPGGTTPGYNYRLMANYGDIFSPDKKFNSESIFEIQHSGSQSYTWSNWNNFKSNVYVQMVGPRSYTGPIYNGSGYGFNPLTPQLVAALKGDPRYGYTVANIDSITKATRTSYSEAYQGVGYYIQKYAPLLKYKATSGTADLNWPNDYIEIRLADTYLMEAEALVQAGTNTARAQALLDAVRARVGLPSVPATLQNIYNERRLELATEGHRWFDLVRTGQAASILAFKNFTPNKNEVLPIPLNELNNTKMVQNPNY